MKQHQVSIMATTMCVVIVVDDLAAKLSSLPLLLLTYLPCTSQLLTLLLRIQFKMLSTDLGRIELSSLSHTGWEQSEKQITSLSSGMALSPNRVHMMSLCKRKMVNMPPCGICSCIPLEVETTRKVQIV